MKEGKEFVIVYVTCSNVEEARKIGRLLVEQRLAACVNIIPQIFSFYWWENEIVADKEAVMLAKTKSSLVKKLIETVKSHHSYQLPAILVLPVVDGNPDFFNWLREETVS